MIIKAPAKINLTLDITGRRDDGYHTIESIMQTVTIFDEIKIEESSEISLVCDKSYLPVNEKNTAYKAARLFFEHTGIKSGAKISIKKRIPGRAGMGGGSADAAAVLKGLNELFDIGLDESTLSGLGTRVGADVPFCVLGGTVKCTGIGEITERLDPMPDCNIVVCKPPTGMSTPRAYSLVDKFPKQTRMGTERMVMALKTGSIRSVSGAVSNRFDEVMKLYQVRNIKKRLMSYGALTAMMTGSGSAVYGIFEFEKQAKTACNGLKNFGEVFLAKPLNI